MARYRELMVEIKYRTDAIADILDGRLGPIKAKIAEEYCFLQLRMICEIIANGCLIIHGNLKPKADLFKTNKASWIMSELSKLHPKFYPRALTEKDEFQADGTPKWVEKTSGFLTSRELQDLWSRHCGTVLHRGSAKSILTKERPLAIDKVRGWTNKIVRLLERHTLITPDENYVFYVAMNVGESGEVATNLFRLARPDEIPRRK